MPRPARATSWATITSTSVEIVPMPPQASSILNVFRATVSAIAATDTPGQVLVIPAIE